MGGGEFGVEAAAGGVVPGEPGGGGGEQEEGEGEEAAAKPAEALGVRGVGVLVVQGGGDEGRRGPGGHAGKGKRKLAGCQLRVGRRRGGRWGRRGGEKR